MWSGALIGIAIVVVGLTYCLRMTDKRQEVTEVKYKCHESTTKQPIFLEYYSSLEKASEFCCSSFAVEHKTLP